MQCTSKGKPPARPITIPPPSPRNTIPIAPPYQTTRLIINGWLWEIRIWTLDVWEMTPERFRPWNAVRISNGGGWLCMVPAEEEGGDA